MCSEGYGKTFRTCCIIWYAVASGKPTTCTRDLETYSRVLPLSLKSRTLNWKQEGTKH